MNPTQYEWISVTWAIIKLNAKNKEGKINCKTLIANFNSCCFSAWKDTLVLTMHLFIAAVNI